MKVTDTQETAIRRVIRDAIALDPLIAYRKVIDIVEKKLGRAISQEYALKLIKKVNREMVPNLDKEKIDRRVGQLREDYRLMREHLLPIAYGQVITNDLGIPSVPTIDEQRKAWDTIHKLGKNLLEMEMDLGVFTRHVGEVEINVRLKPLDTNVRANIIKAFDMWEARLVEPRVLDIEAFITPPKNESNQPIITVVEPAKAESEPIAVAGPGMAISE